MQYFYWIIAVLVVSLISVIGIIVIGYPMAKLKKVLVCFMAFSVGILLGDAFLHLLPEVTEENGFSLIISCGIMGGIFLWFIIEKILTTHRSKENQEVQTFAWMNLVGDMVHNSIDGIIIGTAFMIDIHAGIATTLAVILHEIPQEIGDFCVLVHGGFSKKKALLYNFFTALTAFIGLWVVFLLNTYVEGISEILVPLSAGLFIYIAASDMIPELHKESNLKHSFHQIFFLLIGFAVMYGLTLTEAEHEDTPEERVQIEQEFQEMKKPDSL